MMYAHARIALFLLAGSAFAETISIRADPWCPFNCEPKAAKPGYMIEIAKAVFEKAGHKVDYQNLNWSRALADARDGKIVAVVGAGDEEIKEYQLIKPAQALGKNINCFIAPKDSSWKYSNTASLNGKRVGTIQDYSYGDKLDAYFKANKGVTQAMVGDDALQRNLEKLKNKRLDAVVDDRAVLLYSINQNKLGDQLKEVGCDSENASTGLHIAFSPKHPKSKEFAKQLADGVVTMRKDGSLKSILDQYGVPDWQ